MRRINTYQTIICTTASSKQLQHQGKRYLLRSHKDINLAEGIHKLSRKCKKVQPEVHKACQSVATEKGRELS